MIQIKLKVHSQGTYYFMFLRIGSQLVDFGPTNNTVDSQRVQTGNIGLMCLQIKKYVLESFGKHANLKITSKCKILRFLSKGVFYDLIFCKV